MARGVENPQFAGINPDNIKGVRLHATTDGGKNGGIPADPKEALSQLSVEFKIADLANEKVLHAIAIIFGQDSVIQHLSAIFPPPEKTKTPRNIDLFRKRLPSLMPGIVIDPDEIFRATTEDIKAYFKAKEPSKTKVIVAESIGPNPEILGTVTVEKPGGAVAIAHISKLAVTEKARGKGIGEGLIKTATVFALCPIEEGGWGYLGVEANIIQIPGGEKPQTAFQRNGYLVQGTRHGHISWDNARDEFVPRTVLLVYLDGSNYKPDLTYLPKSA